MMQKAKIVRQIDMKMFMANIKIERERKEARFNRLNRQKENPFYLLRKVK